ncbi:hypothetical protein Nepgr_003278 [Nepenthes gracilis]|uniref:Peptidase S49 domain-containing protein n=1 Tax=Nepenthes gracilis TaxID=150966 RepID=A0AAD3XDA3_NEPGR|nr:hypothetical protein Nepgr_003278 [Nepenthes gracilis]
MGFNKEILSRGKYAEFPAAEQRPFRPDEADLFAKSAEYAYKLFRDKATYSRSMPVDKMEDNAQGRVWTGTDCHGLIDAIVLPKWGPANGSEIVADMLARDLEGAIGKDDI